MFIEVHMLKNYAPSNLNRDDTGSPKSCIFGGIPRGRISSQCIKRTFRERDSMFRTAMGEALFGLRTRKLPEEVGKELKKRGFSDEWVAAAVKKVTGFGNRDGKENDDNITSQILFITQEEVKIVADCIEAEIARTGNINAFNKIKAEDIQKSMKKSGFTPVTLDIALFGRMITSDAFRDVEAALQMAHAISTNKVEREFDYFTAIDDLVGNSETDDAGAGMVGDTEFNSNCYYLYYAWDMDQLLENLKGVDDASEIAYKAAVAFLRAVAYTNPSGKQNSFAAHQLPSAICVEIKIDKIPVSYANAFLQPAKWSASRDLATDSIEKLVSHINEISSRFNDIKVNKRIWFATSGDIPAPAMAETAKDMSSLLKLLDSSIREVK